jgi:hypothetical protein
MSFLQVCKFPKAAQRGVHQSSIESLRLAVKIYLAFGKSTQICKMIRTNNFLYEKGCNKY